MKKRTKAAFTGPHLEMIAAIVRAIPEDDVRQIIANHFGQEFLRRLTAFNAQRWSDATGGKLTGPAILKRAPG